MVRIVSPHDQRGASSETHSELRYWRNISDRGQRLVQTWSKDPDPKTLGRKLSENYALSEPQISPHLRRRNIRAEGAIGSAATILPAFLQATALSASSARQDNNNRMLSLPLEIRNMVYQHCVSYPPVKELFHAYYSQQRLHGNAKRRFSVQHSTPTIYLLCKQITREALYILRRRLLVFDRFPPWLMGDPDPLGICNFIHKNTLQKVRYLELRIALGEGGFRSGGVWINVVSDLLDALTPRNSIIELKVLVKLHRVDLLQLWDRELGVYELLVRLVSLQV